MADPNNPLLETLPVSSLASTEENPSLYSGRCPHGHILKRLKQHLSLPLVCNYCRKSAAATKEDSLLFANPCLAELWHPQKNGHLLPEHIKPKSGLVVWWKGLCGHEWKNSPHKQTSRSGCVFCSGGRLLPGFNDLATTDPVIARQWHPTKNTIVPSEVTRGSNVVVWWICPEGHEWDTSPKNRVKGRNCRYCGKKASACEAIVLTELESLFAGLEIRKNRRPILCHGRRMELDFWLPTLKIAFEVQDLATHSKYSDEELGAFLGWRGFKKGPTYHTLKKELAKEQLGVTVFEIWEDEIASGKFRQKLRTIRDSLG